MADASTLPDSEAVSLLRTLALCDLVNSTGLIERLGDRRGAELIRRHDRLARSLAHANGGSEIDKTDGFLFLFERPVQAVAFALAYQRELKELGAKEGVELAARTGIHVGDVLVWNNDPDDVRRGAKPVEVEGFVKPVAARLMELALPHQILLSGTAYDIAHRAQGELGNQLPLLRWRAHGRYRFKGVPDPVAVFEVGEERVAPLKAPPWSGKAHREVPFWRRPAMLAAELAVLLLAVAIPAWYLFKPAPAIAFAQRDWVVVGDLKNLTGDVRLDDSLQAAFRIGLEQSRYVNLMPDLKTRETLRLMQRDPKDTPIDRAVGSEIAIRDGARALILPTVAEIGGRVRVTAEVVDPHTQTTVWSESADGSGEESVLPSLDQVNRQLRLRLGEALASVSETTRPLDKVTTPNLDALRMYSLGLQKMGEANFPDALGFFREALKLDPQFGGAHLQIGRVMFSSGRKAEAREALRAALALPERLSRRDELLAAAQLASIETPLASLEKWKLLAATYPDFTMGTGTYAYVLWQVANRYDEEALRNARASAVKQNPLRAPALHLLGVLELGNERYAQAIDAFREAELLGFGAKPYHVAALAARGERESAARLLPPPPSSFSTHAVLDTLHAMLRISLVLTDGDATATAIASARRIADRPAAFDKALRFTELALLDPGVADTRVRILAALAEARAEPRPAEPDAQHNRAGHRLLLAWLAARAGATEAATSLLAEQEAEGGLAGSPVLAGLVAVVEAQLALADGRANDAVARLKPLLDGSELVLVRVVLRDAYARAGEPVHADEQTRWLATHPGRAYAEYSLDSALMAFNVAQVVAAASRPPQAKAGGDAPNR